MLGIIITSISHHYYILCLSMPHSDVTWLSCSVCESNSHHYYILCCPCYIVTLHAWLSCLVCESTSHHYKLRCPCYIYIYIYIYSDVTWRSCLVVCIRRKIAFNELVNVTNVFLGRKLLFRKSQVDFNFQ